ncbi:DUF397 domain-containing protein [Actinomadura sp. NAK00032]|uniref:DUF397 domain-containing protein n=1 Tax=Actinomadura sp. NAK00032 TaxID=2742128 RepID=UPI001590E4B6|nr:DUF397 domain-containing protein [Actinomadura sp. NAK00032]QKW40090.1 DUF397 domain-containing protein [Actinomadura sp. NAK00032]
MRLRRRQVVRWRKSSHSGAEPQTCVECALLPNGLEGAVGIRDSTDPSGPHLTLTPETWSALLVQLKTGGLERQT